MHGANICCKEFSEWDEKEKEPESEFKEIIT